MEKVRPWCGQPSDRRRLKNRTEISQQSLVRTVYPPSWRGQGHVTHFYIWGPGHIFGVDEARHFKFGSLD